MTAPGGVLVDVGIPTHGRPDYVRQAVESVLSQTLDAWRLRISEDGPEREGVRRALEPYLDDSRISYSATGERVGAARNMTGLIRSGSAPYVGLLHDDDLWAPEFLRRRVDFLEQHPACGFVFSAHVDIDGEGREWGRSVPRLAAGVHPRERFAARMLRENVVDTPTVLVRRSAYEACGPQFDGSFRRMYDWEMMLRLAIHFPVGYLMTWDAYYRTHGDQTSTQHNRGAEYLAIVDHGDRLAARVAPHLRLGRSERRRQRSGFLLSAALDDLEAEDRGGARRNLRSALAERPLAVTDRRFAAVLTSFALGRTGTRAVARFRAGVFRRRQRPDRRTPTAG